MPVAIVELAIQVAFANGYGYHRDELYFRTAARHPALGYDDQGPPSSSGTRRRWGASRTAARRR